MVDYLNLNGRKTDAYAHLELVLTYPTYLQWNGVIAADAA
jgi:hypothetical protein